jgi:hypothetical protein
MEAGTEPMSFMRSRSSRTICASVAEAVSIGAKIPVISGLPIRGQVRPLEPWNSTIRCIPIYLLATPGNNNSRKLGRAFFPGFGARSRRSGFAHWSVVLCSWFLPLGKGSAGGADFRVPEGTLDPVGTRLRLFPRNNRSVGNRELSTTRLPSAVFLQRTMD